MMDIFKIKNGDDIVFRNTNQLKAGNVVSTQIGSLVYAPDFGSNIEFFLFSEFVFQDDNLKAHFLERLAYHQVKVESINEEIGKFDKTLTYNLGRERNTQGIIT